MERKNMERYKKFFKEKGHLKNLDKYDVRSDLNLGDKLFINEIGAYYTIALDKGKKYYQYKSLIIPSDWDEDEVKIV